MNGTRTIIVFWPDELLNIGYEFLVKWVEAAENCAVVAAVSYKRKNDLLQFLFLVTIKITFNGGHEGVRA